MYKNNKITVLSHLLIWVFLFSMPYLLSYGQETEINRIIAHFWIPLFFSAVIFYINYFVLVDRFLFPRRMILFIGINLIFITLFLLSKEFIESTYFSELQRRGTKPDGSAGGPPFKMFIYVQTLSYMAPLFFAIAIKSTKRWVQTEAERKEAAHFKLQSELQHLHYQLQPHFFFNSLNNIYALVDVSPDQAKTTIHSLSKLMRYMLYESNVELILLSKEIDFMKKYIDLMKLRVSDKTQVQSNFPTEETGIKIAPLLFLSLIENAFKHGVSANKESLITIDLKVNGSKICLTVENDNFPQKSADEDSSGIGLQNLEKRIELLYPNKYQLSASIKEKRFVVQVEVETT